MILNDGSLSRPDYVLPAMLIPIKSTLSDIESLLEEDTRLQKQFEEEFELRAYILTDLRAALKWKG